MKFADNTIKASYDYFQLQLKGVYEVSEIRNLARICLEELLGYDMVRLSMEPDLRLSESEMLTLIRAVKELKKGRPIQYILGFADFLGLRLNVDEHTLIPRPETEELVEWIYMEANKDDLRILDIGTGSGCIALALKHKIPASTIVAMDVSPQALHVAAENRQKLKLDVLLEQDDVLRPSAMEDWPPFDLIVSNPPYVKRSSADQLHRNVKENEPHSALFVPDEDALIFYRRIADYALKKLLPGGYLYFEINEDLGEEVCELLTSKQFAQVELKQDLNGKDRMVRCRLT